MKVLAMALAVLAAACSTYDPTDYTAQIRERAAAELQCDAAAIQITPIPDDHGVHTFVCEGCGCMATYICDWKDFDSCNREPTLEPDDASCR
jgi:hypothetical protein